MRGVKAVVGACLLLVLGMTAPFSRPVAAAICDQTPGVDHLTVFTGPNYTFSCATLVYGSYSGATEMGVPENSIRSVKIGAADSSTQKPLFFACTGLSFGGDCEWLPAGNIIDTRHDPSVPNFYLTISSFRVQAVRTSNLFASPQCTWGAAKHMYAAIGYYPGWTGNGEDWDANAKAVGWKTGSTPKVNAIVSFPGGSKYLADWGSDPTDASKPSLFTFSVYGHVAWVTDVSSHPGWIRVSETGAGYPDSAYHNVWYRTTADTGGNPTYIYLGE